MPSPGLAIVQAVPAGLSAAEQEPAEQVPAYVHSVAAGQVTPAQGSQHAVQSAAAQPSVHSRRQAPAPQHSSGAGDARARAIEAPSASSASSAREARGQSAIASAKGDPFDPPPPEIENVTCGGG
jgi:hypothetical protein